MQEMGSFFMTEHLQYGSFGWLAVKGWRGFLCFNELSKAFVLLLPHAVR